MELKFVKNQNDTEASLFLYGGVGCEIDGNQVAAELRWLDEAGIETINVHINSSGGSILDGFSIVSAIMRSKAKVVTINDGMAASMAGIILMVGDEVESKDFATLMIHEPSIGFETIETTEDDKTRNALLALRDSLADIIIARSGKEREEVNEIMNVETWYNAKDAKKQGFIDRIVKMAITPKVKEKASIDEKVEMICNFYNENKDLLTNNEIKMDKLTNHFGLDAEATQEDILAKIETAGTELEEIKNELGEAKTDLEAATAELEDSKNALEAEKAEKTVIALEKEEAENKLNEYLNANEDLKNKLAEKAVNDAIDCGKFHESKRDELLERAKDDLEGFAWFVDSIKIPVAKVTDLIEKNIPAANKEWTIREWEKKDPAGLKKIKDETPELYEEMYNSYYKK